MDGARRAAVSPQDHPQVGTTTGEHMTLLGLLGELRDVRAENRKLRRRVAALEAGRSKWKREAIMWRWKPRRKEHAAHMGEAVSPSGAAEASVGG